MKIGVLGGTFNPIHNSHLYLAIQYKEYLKLDKILLVPTYIPPHKIANDLASANDRVAMCRLAAEDYDFLDICTYEVDKKGLSYTYETLEYLANKCTASDFFLLMGADMFLTFLDWKNPNRIAEVATICTAAREQNELDRLKAQKEKLGVSGIKAIVLEIDPKPLSSTQIRNTIKSGESVAKFIPNKVLQYIKEYKLYQ